MGNIDLVMADMAWPLTIFMAWLLGEWAQKWIRLPRISAYAAVGFVFSTFQLGFLPKNEPVILLIANVAFGLLLFECGYYINIRWLRTNPWIGITSLAEAMLTFVAVYVLMRLFDQPMSTALLFAALSMATSPATIVRVINEQRSSGQVTERILHLSVFNSVLAVLTFKIIVGLVVFQTSGNFWSAAYNSVFVLAVSFLLGGVLGAIIPAILRITRRANYDSTLAFTIAVICLVVLTHGLKLSPVLATLMFGVSARHHRIVLNSSQRGFGALGDLLSLLLFVFVAASIEWKQAAAGIGLGILIIIVRQIAKIVGIGLFSHVSGISRRKGALIGIASAPISVFVILVLEQTRYLGIELVDQLAPLAAMALILEFFGPILVRQSLLLAHEIPEHKDR